MFVCHIWTEVYWKSCKYHTYTQTILTLKRERGSFVSPIKTHRIGLVKSQKALHRNSNTTLSQVCRLHWNSFIKTLQDRESFTINKRGKTLLLPLFSYKTASYYFIFKVWFLQDREKKTKKNMLWYEECCKSLKTLWKAINQWLVPQILTLFASMVQNNTVKY